MIVFDLACGAGGHIFEAWFGSSDDYESQRARGLVNCPICGSADVNKAVMAPNVAPKGNQRSTSLARPDDAQQPDMAVASNPSPGAIKAMMAALADAQAKALEGSDYVGADFAREARAIHAGETDERPIHGQATSDEARALIEDGIPVAALPLPMRPPGRDN